MPDIGNIGPVFPAARGDESASRQVQLHLVHPDHTALRDSRRDETLVGRGDAASRRERIEAIRAAIADGSYPTDEKLQLAMRLMIDELRG